MDRVVVPFQSEVNVLVQLAWVAFQREGNNTKWELGTKHTPLGVVMARSLMPKEGSQPFFRAIYLSDQSCNLPAELCVGRAYPAVVVGGHQNGSVTDPPVQDGRDGDQPSSRAPPPRPATDGRAPSVRHKPRYFLPHLDWKVSIIFNRLCTILPILYRRPSLSQLSVWCMILQMFFPAPS